MLALGERQQLSTSRQYARSLAAAAKCLQRQEHFSARAFTCPHSQSKVAMALPNPLLQRSPTGKQRPQLPEGVTLLVHGRKSPSKTLSAAQSLW